MKKNLFLMAAVFAVLGLMFAACDPTTPEDPVTDGTEQTEGENQGENEGENETPDIKLLYKQWVGTAVISGETWTILIDFSNQPVAYVGMMSETQKMLLEMNYNYTPADNEFYPIDAIIVNSVDAAAGTVSCTSQFTEADMTVSFSNLTETTCTIVYTDITIECTATTGMTIIDHTALGTPSEDAVLL